MPTPFQHLIYAELVGRHSALPPVVRDVLAEAPGAYLLGNVAPDVQTITGQRRFETHFYGLDHPREPTALERLLATCPELREPRRMSPDRAAFVSGYVVHLTWDEVWMWEIFLPFFRNGPSFRRGDQGADRLSYFLHHNALRALLDRQAYGALHSSGRPAQLLRRTAVSSWLPFVSRDVLSAWRDLIVEQLDDPSLVRTLEVFAKRMRVPVRQVSEIVETMEADTYAAIPGLAEALERYEHCGLNASVRALLRYWQIEARLEERKGGAGGLRRVGLIAGSDFLCEDKVVEGES
ncbi:MAG: zinc dependent phospholipase C family protein [Anaerolineae bacterium]